MRGKLRARGEVDVIRVTYGLEMCCGTALNRSVDNLGLVNFRGRNTGGG